MEGKLQKIRIAWVLDDFPNPYQEYIKNLLDNLRSKYGLTITIVTYNLIRKELRNEYSIVEIKVNRHIEEIIKRLTFSKLNRVERILAKYDIVHIQHSFLYPVISGLSQNFQKPKVIITFRGADSYIKPWVSSRWRSYHKEISNNFTAIQVMSENQKEYLMKWGHKASNIYKIPISTSTTECIFEKMTISVPLRICSVFRMVWEKNIELNLRLVKQINKRGIKVNYDVYGDGADMGQLFYLVNRFGMSDYVKIHGRVNPTTLSESIKSNHLMLQLSSSEALPASVIEALSVGMPCIVSDVGGLTEIIETNVNGYVLNFNDYDLNDPANFVENIVNNDSFYQRLKTGAFKSYQDKYTPTIEAQMIFEMYSSIL